MTSVSLKYNPYTVESEISIEGVPVQAPSKLFEWKSERIQSWIENLIPALDEICFDNEYILEFYGTRLDYNDVKVVIQDYCEKHMDINVSIQFTEAKGTEDRFQALIELFEDMQQNCPFEDLKTPQIRENFQNAISSDFEVSVIATMSSGKSTLINALLGRELMPSKNEACTATIAKIRDIDGMDGYRAEYRDKANHVLGQFENLCLDDMNHMNDNPETAYIDIEGDIPNIDSSGVRLVLVDTPGPNNSRTEEHKNHTYRVIKEKTKPMVLYVLNGTQLQTNDDRELLMAVSNAMKVGGKQSKDRFLFAVNKIDQFDPDKESVQGALDNVRDYLKKFDIENPNIFPTSAEMAKVIRMHLNGQSLTSGQKRTLRDYDLFIDEPQLHLSEQASLSADNLSKLRENTKQAQESGDQYQEALIYTGVPAVELTIDEYLKKYAYTTKVKTAVDTFRKKVEEKDMQARMMASIQNDELSRERINSELKSVKAQLDEGKAGADFRKKIQGLDMMEDVDRSIRELRAKVNEIAMNRNGQSKMTPWEVQSMMMRLETRVHNLQSDVKTELENMINDVVYQEGMEIISDYRLHMRKLLSGGGLQTGEYATDCGIDFLMEDLPDAQQLIDQYRYTEEGEVEWVKNPDKHWWNPFTWFAPRFLKQKISDDKEMVDAEAVYAEYIDPILDSFNRNLDSAREAAQKEANRFKRYFLKELDKLEDVLKQKVEENEKLTRNQQSLNEKIRRDKEKIEWLNHFIDRLDEILAI